MGAKAADQAVGCISLTPADKGACIADQRFKIVFSDELMPNASLGTVEDNLACLFESEPGKISALLGDRPVALKREPPEAEAERYLTALRQVDTNACKEADLATSLSLAEMPDHDPQVTEKTPAQDLSLMTCPKYGREQPSGAECSACGIIIEKCLARRAQPDEDVAPTVAAGTGASASPYTPPSTQVSEALPEFNELNVFTTNGRIGRLRYLGWSMAMALCFLVIMGPGFLLGETVGMTVTVLASIAFIVTAMMIGIQRLHDPDWSGWLWLLNFVPFVGSVFGILMLVLPGSTGANRCDPPPPMNGTRVKVLASLIILLPIVGVITTIALSSCRGYLECANHDGGASAPADPYAMGEQAAAAAAGADEAVTMAAEAMEDDDQQQPRNPSRRAGPNSLSALEKSRMSRYALITGVSNGIGLTLVETLTRRNRALILVVRQYGTLEGIAYGLVRRFSVEVLFRTYDPSKPLQLSGLLHRLGQGERRIDLLVNSAGIGTSDPFIDQGWAWEQELIEPNILVLARLCHSPGVRMAAQGGGRILDITSVAAFQPGAWVSNCYASKAYVPYFSEDSRGELRGRDARVSALYPGSIRTTFFREVGMRLGRLDRSRLIVTPEEVALLTLRGLNKDYALIIPGWRNRLLALSLCLAPRWLVHRFATRISVLAIPSIPRG